MLHKKIALSFMVLLSIPVAKNYAAEKTSFTDLYQLELEYKTSGNWQIANGNLIARAENSRQNGKLVSLKEYHDFILNSRIVFSGKNLLAICFRSTPSEAYILYIYPSGLTKFTRINYNPKLSKTDLAVKRIRPLELNMPYRLQVVAVGNRIAMELQTAALNSEGLIMTAEVDNLSSESPVTIEIQRDATPGNYAFEIQELTLSPAESGCIDRLFNAEKQTLLENMDMSYYQDRSVLLGYPSLISQIDKERILARETTFNDLKYNLRMVAWTYGDITREEAEATVKKLKAKGVNTIISAGNRYILRNLGANIKNSAIIANACHKYGMKFLHHVTTTLVQDEFAKKNPRYSSVDMSTGNPLFTYYNRYATCFNNNDFWDEYMKQLEELFRQVKMDGIMVDEIQYWGDHTCGCNWCRKKFKEVTGHELPSTADKNFFRNLSNPVYKQWLNWRSEGVQNRNMEIRRLMQKYMPDGGFYPSYLCNPTVAGTWNAFYRCALQLEKAITYSSSIGNEFEPAEFNYFYTWPMAVAEMKFVKAINRSLNANPWFYFYPTEYGDYVWCWILAMTMGANVWFPGENTPSETIEKCRTPIIEWMAKYQDVLGNTRPFSDTGLLWSADTRDFCPEGIAWRQGYIGLCQLMTDTQTAYQVLLDQDLNSEVLEQLKTLLLFNTVCISDRNLQAIRNFVKAGGTLIASGQVSLRDETGKDRKNFGLADLLGCSHGSYAKDNENSLIIPEKSQRIAGITGTFIHDRNFVKLINIASDCMIAGMIKDSSGKEHPGIIVRNYGKGRVMYFAGHPEQHYINQDHDIPNRLPLGGIWQDRRSSDYCKIIAGAIRFMNPEPSVKVENLCRGVVVEAYHQQSHGIEGTVVHLANFSGADMKAGIVPRRFDITFPPIMPRADIQVAVKTENINNVFLISPDFKNIIELDFAVENGYTRVAFPALYRYALLYFVKSGTKKIIDIAGNHILKHIPDPVKMVHMENPSVVGEYNPDNITFFADDQQLKGGYLSRPMIGGRVKLIYGSESKYDTVKARFKLPRQPKQLTISLGGSQYALPGKSVPVKISLNGKIIFNDNDPLPKGEKHESKTFDLDSKLLNTDGNEIEISNLYPSLDGKPPYLKISFIKIFPIY